MNKLVYKIMTIVVTTVTVLTLSITSVAAEIDERNYYEYPSVEDIIMSLYENEPDPTVKAMAVDSALVLTGLKEPITYYTNGAVLVGRYSTNNVEPSTQCMISLLGEHSMRLGIGEGQFAVSTSPGEPLTQTAIARNIEDLKDFYFMANAVKTATAGMSDISKLWYIEYYVMLLAPKYVSGTDSVMARVVENGISDCEGYAALTYLFGINCGLDINCVMGIANGGSHVWNEVVFNGRTYWHDTTWDLTSKSDLYFVTSPRSYDPSEQYIVHNITEMNPVSVTYQEVR